jgi:hypothetical protein
LLLETDEAKRGALETKLRALGVWKLRLEAALNKLTEEAGTAGEELEFGTSSRAASPALTPMPMPAISSGRVIGWHNQRSGGAVS